MTALRQRLIEDLQLRNFSPHTVEAYPRAVSNFSKHFGRPPDQEFLMNVCLSDKYVGELNFNPDGRAVE